jgi:hypothetical protein
MKIRILSLVAVSFLAMSGMACRHHHAEGPVDKAKDVIHDIGHDTKELGHDIKHDIKK